MITSIREIFVVTLYSLGGAGREKWGHPLKGRSSKKTPLHAK